MKQSAMLLTVSGVLFLAVLGAGQSAGRIVPGANGRILFSHFVSTGAADLFTMTLDGDNLTPVTRTQPTELESQWAAA